MFREIFIIVPLVEDMKHYRKSFKQIKYNKLEVSTPIAAIRDRILSTESRGRGFAGRRSVPQHEKTNKISVCPVKTQISLSIHPVWSVFAVRMKKAWALNYPLSAQRRRWSDWADAKADLNFRWAHSHFVGFVMSRLKSSWLSVCAVLFCAVHLNCLCFSFGMEFDCIGSWSLPSHLLSSYNPSISVFFYRRGGCNDTFKRDTQVPKHLNSFGHTVGNFEIFT